jgi:hypothetical protein
MGTFVQQCFDDNDLRAREKAKELLSPRFEVKDNPDQYGIDLLCYKNGELKYQVEVEVKNLWSGNEFHWSEINVPIRKEKFFKQGKVMYIMFNTDLTSCFIVSGETILSCKKEEVPNRRHISGEYFFKVPVHKVYHHKDI